MIEIIKNKTNIKFTGMFGITSIVSLILVVGSLFLLFTKMQYGVDFRGGAEVQVKFADGLSVRDLRASLDKAGFALLNFGTGPIRGFAVTLLIGIFATVYTSYFVGSLLFELYMNKVEGQELSI